MLIYANYNGLGILNISLNEYHHVQTWGWKTWVQNAKTTFEVHPFDTFLLLLVLLIAYANYVNYFIIKLCAAQNIFYIPI